MLQDRVSKNMYGIYLASCYLRLLAVPVISAIVGDHDFGEPVTLRCFVVEGVVGESYNFTWGAPTGSSSLETGTITSDATRTTLTFYAREEDNGIFTCMIDGSSTVATVTVGNASLLHNVHYQDQCSIPLIQFQIF